MTIKYTIKNSVECFHIEAPSVTVWMKLNPDLQSMLTAGGLCRISGTHLGKGLKDAKVGTPCVCEHVCASAEARIAHSSSDLVDK